MICLLGFIFQGTPPVLPCGDGTVSHLANVRLLDCNGDGAIDLSDVIYKLSFQFQGGPRPVQGTECIGIPDCPDTNCTSAASQCP
jgi:hypothetical protein